MLLISYASSFQLCICKEQAKKETALKSEALNQKASIQFQFRKKSEVSYSGFLFNLWQFIYLQVELTCGDYIDLGTWAVNFGVF